uniref:Uncharacterized protein n=1 Tax=Eutreptiella gymnastica TaxID=73025 RepID=A0A7S4GIF6_9EUGL
MPRAERETTALEPEVSKNLLKVFNHFPQDASYSQLQRWGLFVQGGVNVSFGSAPCTSLLTWLLWLSLLLLFVILGRICDDFRRLLKALSWVNGDCGGALSA